MLKIGKQLRALRSEKGWTQDVVAKGVGVSKEQISRIETDANEPSAETMAKLADLFGVPMDALRAPKLPAAASELERALIDAAQRAQGSPDALAEVRRLVEALTKADGDRALEAAASSHPTKATKLRKGT